MICTCIIVPLIIYAKDKNPVARMRFYPKKFSKTSEGQQSEPSFSRFLAAGLSGSSVSVNEPPSSSSSSSSSSASSTSSVQGSLANCEQQPTLTPTPAADPYAMALMSGVYGREVPEKTYETSLPRAFEDRAVRLFCRYECNVVIRRTKLSITHV